MEMRGWHFYPIGGGITGTISYVGKDGVNLTCVMSHDNELFAGHENDPAWTGFNSAAPSLPILKRMGRRRVI